MVRHRQNKNQGTPGSTLCGIDRFAKDSPGWSVGGGVSGEGKACHACADARAPGLPVGGMHAGLFTALAEEDDY